MAIQEAQDELQAALRACEELIPTNDDRCPREILGGGAGPKRNWANTSEQIDACENAEISILAMRTGVAWRRRRLLWQRRAASWPRPRMRFELSLARSAPLTPRWARCGWCCR